MTMSPSGTKASMRFREEQSPLFRVKFPVTAFGLPLFSGADIGEKEELALKVGTGFDVGPQLRLVYKPHNDAAPQSVVVKVGLGPWGSPTGSLLSVVVEHTVSNGQTNFTLRGHPRAGDFSLRRNHVAHQLMQNFSRSIPSKGTPVTMEKGVQSKSFAEANGNGNSNGNGALSQNGLGHEPLSPPSDGEQHAPKGEIHGSAANQAARPRSLPSAWAKRKSPVWGPKSQEGVWAMNVHSEMPVGKLGFASCRWGLLFSLNEMMAGGLTTAGLPHISLDKLSFETRKLTGAQENVQPISKQETVLTRLSDDVMILHAENCNLKKAMDDLRTEFSRAGKKGLGGNEEGGLLSSSGKKNDKNEKGKNGQEKGTNRPGGFLKVFGF
eukprot:TRINITY_DN26663_c0_g1_i1.p1 TRINITY_DN26663_c0_g1~~TRINITY_DN26663_c0_g1_i1.p1  ORF type:complete len:381 (-),score=62.36 TRINITY_DN26663_c0_g1_i1:1170-2312(-)